MRKAILWPVKLVEQPPDFDKGGHYEISRVRGFNDCHDQFMKKIREAGL